MTSEVSSATLLCSLYAFHRKPCSRMSSHTRNPIPPAVMSRITELADMVDQKNAIYNRAAAFDSTGQMDVDRLDGVINVLKNNIVSSISSWYTDDSGNIVFESVDGTSAMMLSGEGFAIADGKTQDGAWNWRTKMYHWFSPQRCGKITN